MKNIFVFKTDRKKNKNMHFFYYSSEKISFFFAFGIMPIQIEPKNVKNAFSAFLTFFGSILIGIFSKSEKKIIFFLTNSQKILTFLALFE